MMSSLKTIFAPAPPWNGNRDKPNPPTWSITTKRAYGELLSCFSMTHINDDRQDFTEVVACSKDRTKVEIVRSLEMSDACGDMRG